MVWIRKLFNILLNSFQKVKSRIEGSSYLAVEYSWVAMKIVRICTDSEREIPFLLAKFQDYCFSV